jgi:hypothetical protein
MDVSIDLSVVCVVLVVVAVDVLVVVAMVDMVVAVAANFHGQLTSETAVVLMVL